MKLVIVAILSVVVAVGMPSPVGSANDVTDPFDHSTCQYPDRTTNPPNGCDNSDPCDPSNVKDGSGECKPEHDMPPGTQDPVVPPQVLTPDVDTSEVVAPTSYK